MTSGTYKLFKLTANLSEQIDSGDPDSRAIIWLSYITILLASIVIEIIATFYRYRFIRIRSTMTWLFTHSRLKCR